MEEVDRVIFESVKNDREKFYERIKQFVAHFCGARVAWMDDSGDWSGVLVSHTHAFFICRGAADAVRVSPDKLFLCPPYGGVTDFLSFCRKQEEDEAAERAKNALATKRRVSMTGEYRQYKGGGAAYLAELIAGLPREEFETVVGADGQMVRTRRFNPNPETGRISGANPPTRSARELTVKLDTKDIEKMLREKLEPLKKAQEAALSLLRGLPTRALDAPMRARVLEVQRMLVESIRPDAKGDYVEVKGHGMTKLGDACARAVAAYDD